MQSECRSISSQVHTEINTTTHLVKNEAEERTDDRETFELEAKGVRNRRHDRRPVINNGQKK